MPNLQDELAKFAGSSIFASFDLMQGYWQLPLHQDSQESQSFITPFGVYTPTRVQHGTTNATTYLQRIMTNLMAPLLDRLAIWLDDNACHSASEDEHLDFLESFFAIIEESGLKLHAGKTILFTRTLEYCGRVITAEGITLAPKSLKAIQDMQPPTMGDQLQQFLGACNWVRSGVPEYARLVHPLTAAMEQVYKEAGRRTKAAVAKVSLSPFWGEEQTTAFENLKKELTNMCKLAFPDQKKRLCVFADASEKFYGGMITQVAYADLDLPFAEQAHEPLGFISGSFTGSQTRWTIPEKEGFAVVQAVTGMEYLLMAASEFSIFSDHRNLKFIYNPHSVDPTLAKHTVHKLQRWALKLAVFCYEIEFIPGEENVWADMMSRWCQEKGREVKMAKLKLTANSRLFMAPVEAEICEEDWQMPTPQDILMAQKAAIGKYGHHAHGKPEMMRGVNGAFVDSQGRYWVPKEAVELQVRICVTYTGS